MTYPQLYVHKNSDSRISLELVSDSTGRHTAEVIDLTEKGIYDAFYSVAIDPSVIGPAIDRVVPVLIRGSSDPVIVKGVFSGKQEGELSDEEYQKVLNVLGRYQMTFYKWLWPKVDNCDRETEIARWKRHNAKTVEVLRYYLPGPDHNPDLVRKVLDEMEKDGVYTFQCDWGQNNNYGNGIGCSGNTRGDINEAYANAAAPMLIMNPIIELFGVVPEKDKRPGKRDLTAEEFQEVLDVLKGK